MKNNRQIGLDGKIFISTAMRRGTFFVFMLMLYGIITAVADILKLTGESGVAMGSFTTTLLIYDFIVSLMLVVVVFYAYFLECGADVPVVKEKPLMIFGFFRLGYYLLLSYYLCYRMLYCAVNRETVSTSVCIFYGVYLCLIVLLILANCYIFNIITRNLIRRRYEKSFHRIAIAGFIVQALMPVSYILARIFMDDIGDEYFTTAVCDLLRLLVAPLFLTSVWFLFLHGVGQVHDVYSEVDSALISKRYQITYSSEVYGKGSRRKGQSAPPATATMLPAGAAEDDVPKALKSAPAEVVRGAAPAASAEPSAAPVENAPESIIGSAVAAEIAESSTEVSAADEAADGEPVAEEAATQGEHTEVSDDEIVASFAAEARKAVAKSSAQSNSKKQPQKGAQQSKKGSAQQNRNAQSVQAQRASTAAQNQVKNHLPVQEFDPYPAASVPHRTPNQNGAQNRQQPNRQPQNQTQKNRQNGVQNQSQQNRNTGRARPANMPAQHQQNVRQPQNNQQPGRQQQAQRPANNSGANRQNQVRGQQNGQRSQNGQRPQNGSRPNTHR